MKDDRIGVFMMGVVVGIIASIIVTLCCESKFNRTLKVEAVQRDYAEWIVDDEGKAEWRWIEPEQSISSIKEK